MIDQARVVGIGHCACRSTMQRCDAPREACMMFDDTCDFLAITFSANREILRTFGPDSREMEDAVLRLDKDIAHLLSFLEREVGRENLLVVLTASRGISYDVKQMTELRMPTGFFNPNQAMTILRSYLNVVYGESNWVKGYHNHQIYLDHVMIEDANINLYAMQDRVADFMMQFSGVSHVMTAHTLREAGNSSPVFMKIQNGFFPKRSGDVFVILNPGWQEKNGHEMNTGSGFWYDSHVPLIWYGWKIPRKNSSRRIDIRTAELLGQSQSQLIRPIVPCSHHDDSVSGRPRRELAYCHRTRHDKG